MCGQYAGFFGPSGQWEPAGILPEQQVEALPPLLQDVISRCVARGVFEPKTRPDSCIINFYEVGDCIPPHIDSHGKAWPGSKHLQKGRHGNGLLSSSLLSSSLLSKSSVRVQTSPGHLPRSRSYRSSAWSSARSSSCEAMVSSMVR